VLVTHDGKPLKVSLMRALARSRRDAFMLVLPLLAFIAVTFLIPIGDMLYRGIDNTIVGEVMPRTVAALKNWDPDSNELPGEEAYAALVKDIQEGAKARTIGRPARRLNYERPGVMSTFRSSARKVKKITEGPYKEKLIEIKDDWGEVGLWKLLKRESGNLTFSYVLAAVDMRFDDDGNVTLQPEERRIYVKLFWRTLWMSGVITFLTLLLGFPIAYLLATLPLRTSNLLMILVLLPFWTSLLVRTTSWIALLQQQGVINDFLVALGLISDESRLALIHNAFGTMIAMTHILLPFMILPLYSVMKTIPPSLMRAARSMGANQALAFVRVYFPLTLPGIGAGGVLVFILAIGYYITPALVGGTSGTFISNFIANHVSVTLNWGLAATLGGLLLALVLVLYYIYNKIVGVENMKLG